MPIGSRINELPATLDAIYGNDATKKRQRINALQAEFEEHLEKLDKLYKAALKANDFED